MLFHQTSTHNSRIIDGLYFISVTYGMVHNDAFIELLVVLNHKLRD